jgi:hypothetical protein
MTRSEGICPASGGENPRTVRDAGDANPPGTDLVADHHVRGMPATKRKARSVFEQGLAIHLVGDVGNQTNDPASAVVVRWLTLTN